MATYSTNTAKNSLLKKIFVQYWKWDILPNFTGTTITVPDNSPEDILLSMYDDYKSEVLAMYPWRSATTYTKITTAVPLTNNDKRYKYAAQVPQYFLISNGYWYDEERHIPAANEVEIVGTEIRTNLKEFTMAWVNANVAETSLDPWVLDYMALHMAAVGADIGGCSIDTKNFLMQKDEYDYQTATNRDFHMAHQDDISDSIHQFEFSY